MTDDDLQREAEQRRDAAQLRVAEGRTMNKRERMAELAESFPTLEGAPGVAPFDAERLDQWADGGGRGSGSQHAVRFILAVWNYRNDWKVGDFNAVRAMGVWDDSHRDAFRQWCAEPWWP